MNWQNLLNEIVKFFQSPQLITIGALIMADVISGVGAAIKNREFDLRRFADFYGTNVLPYGLGYLAVWLLAKLAVPELLGDSAYLVEDGFVWAAWFAIVASIGGSIYGNLKAIGIIKTQAAAFGEPPDSMA